MRLVWMGKANIVLGTVSLVRLITEVLFFWTATDRSKLVALAAFDAAVGALRVLQTTQKIRNFQPR
jgi:hypothetical protein